MYKKPGTSSCGKPRGGNTEKLHNTRNKKGTKKRKQKKSPKKQKGERMGKTRKKHTKNYSPTAPR